MLLFQTEFASIALGKRNEIKTIKKEAFVKLFNKSSLKKTALNVVGLAVAAIMVTAVSSHAYAADQKKKHKREKEVDARANHEEHKNNEAAEEGKITQQQAAKLDRKDQAIKREAKDMAAENGGHLTKGEQKMLNRQENQVNAERRRDERVDARKKAQQGGSQSAPSAGATSAPAAPSTGSGSTN
jgi:hypothetical protein